VKDIEGDMSLMNRICIKLFTDSRLDGPNLSVFHPTTLNKVLLDQPHLSHRLRMSSSTVIGCPKRCLHPLLHVMSYSCMNRASSLDPNLDGPYFGTSIPTTRNKVFIDKPHFLRRFRMSINDHTRMCVSRSIVVLNPIFTGTSNDFT
jgi:hypothetical protein